MALDNNGPENNPAEDNLPNADNLSEDQSSEDSDDTGELSSGGDKAKKLLLVGIFLVLTVLIVLVFIFLKKSGRLDSPSDNINNALVTSDTDSLETASVVNNNQTTNNKNQETVNVITNEITSVVEAPKVVSDSSSRLSLPTPKQTGIMNEANIPSNAIRIVGTPNGFEPSEFSVDRGEPIILALIARSERPVVLTFYDPNMAAVSIGCGPGEARWVNLTTPTKPGEYMFRNDTIGLNGQTGKMIVK